MKSKQRKKIVKIVNIVLSSSLLVSPFILTSLQTVTYAQEKIEKTKEKQNEKEVLSENLAEEPSSSESESPKKETTDSETQNSVNELSKSSLENSEEISEENEKKALKETESEPNKKIEETTFRLSIEEEKAELFLIGKVNINEVYKYAEELESIKELIIKSENGGDFDSTFLANSMPLKQLEILEAVDIETIPGRAFQYAKIKKLTLPKTKKIATKAFEQNQLTSVVLPEVEKLEGTVFYNNQLTKIEMPKIKEIGPWALKGNQLQELNFLELTSASDEAFGDNPLKSVKFPKATGLNQTAFKNVSSIREVEISGLDGTFDNIMKLFLSSKESLEELTVTKMRIVGKGTESEEGFMDWKIKTIHLPEVRTIEEYGFNRSSFSTIEIPNIEEINANAFANTKVQKLVLPATIRKISEDAFKNSELELVTYRDDKKDRVLPALKKTPLILGISETQIVNKKIELDKDLSVPVTSIINEDTAKATILTEWWKDQSKLTKQESTSLEIKKISTADQGRYQGKLKINSSNGELLLNYDSNVFTVSVGNYLAPPKVKKITEKDSTLRGTGISGATVKAMVDGQEIGHGVVEYGDSFSFEIPQQRKGTAIQVIQTLRDEQSEEVTVKVDFLVEMSVIPRGNPQTNKATEQKSASHASMEPTGIFLPQNEELVITVDEEASEVYVKIGQWGSYNEDNPYITTRPEEFLTEKLHKGKNVVKRENTGGMVYIDNQSESELVNVAIEGGTQVPYYKQGTTSLEKFKEQLEENPNVPFLEMVSDNVMGTFQIHRAKDLLIPGNRVNELLDYWELIVNLQNEVSGLNFNVEGANKKHNNRVHITNPDTGAGAAFASEYRISFHSASDRGLLTQTLDDNQYLVWHEIGHTYQNPYYKWSGLTEVTVDIQSEYMQQKLLGTSRIEAPEYVENLHNYLTQPIENRNFDNPGADYDEYLYALQLSMFWILQRVFGDDFYPALNQAYRLLPKNQLPKTDDEMKQTFMKMTSRVVKRNLTPYFEEFGLKVEGETKKELSQYPNLEKEIWKDLGFGERQQLPGLVQKYSIPTADIENVTAPIFTSADKLASIVKVKNPHSVPIESKVTIDKIDPKYTGYGKQKEVVVWLKNELGYQDKLMVNLDATPADTIHFRGNNGASIIVGPNVEEKNFKTAVEKGNMHGSGFIGEDYFHLSVLNGDGSQEKGKVIANGDTKAENFAEQLEKLTYEIGDVIEIYHAESSVRFDRYLNNTLLTPDNEKTYLYRITEHGWQPLINPKAPEVSMVTERDQIITGTGEPGATVTAKVDGVSIGSGKIETDKNFSIKINSQKSGTKIAIDQTINGITSPSSEIIVEKLVDIKTDLISKMVSDQLKIDQTHTFTGSQISKIKNLKISNNPELGKEELKDISKLVSLTSLELPNNKIERIDELSSLTKLTKLDISKNQIKDISAVSTMNELTTLYLNENQIHSVNQLSGLTELTTLYLNNNMIENIDALEKITKLKWLNLSANKISDIQPLSKMTELVTLKVENNQVENIKILANMKALSELILSSNNIENIDVITDLTNLKTLWIGKNQINEISLSKLVQLESLGLENNQIEDIHSLANLTSLKEVWLNNNQIKDLSPIQNKSTIINAKNQEITIAEQENKEGTVILPNVIVEQGITEILGAFTYTPSDKGIYKVKQNELIWENISSFELSYAFSSENGIYTGMVKVPLKGRNEKVIIKSDWISEMIADQLKVEVTHEYTKEQLSKIKEFSIQNNEEFVEKDLEDIAKLSELEKLWIEGVGLKNISPLASNTKLVELYLANNEIEDITALSHMPNLVKFYAEKNKISDLKPLENLGKLTMLWLGTNQIKDVTPLRNKTTMKWLFLENNQVADVSSLTNLTNLVRVYLGSNKLTDISSLANITTEMTDFDVSNNQIKDISPIKDKVLNARNQRVTVEEKELYNGQFNMENVIERVGIEIKLGDFQVKASHKGNYDKNTNKISWDNLDTNSINYEFSFGEGEIYSGVVTIPLKQVELVGPSVDSVVSTDKKITGKADANAVITAKVGDKEISKGNAKSDGSFELAIEAQPEGTKISVIQIVNGHESPATEVVVEKANVTAYNTYKLGYWRDYGFVLEGQSGIIGEMFTNKSDVVKTVELVNTQTNEIELSSNAINTNWYNLTNYDGYQAIITNEMIDKLTDGNYRLQVKMTLKDGEIVTQNLAGNIPLLFGFIGEYQETISGLGKHSVGEKVLQFNEGLGQVTMNVAQGTNQVNVLNSRVNVKEESVLDLWIASKDYDYQAEHTKYIVIKDSSGKEVYNKKAPTWDIKKTFKKQVKAEWEKSGVQAIVPKEFRGADFTKEIQVKDKTEQVTVTTTIPQELLK